MSESVQHTGIERRSLVVTIMGRRYRVREPSPRKGLRVLTQATKLLGPLLVKILEGKVALMKPALCPKCGSERDAQAVNGRWTCGAVSDDGDRCPTVWDQEPELDDDGRQRRVDLAFVLATPSWRAVFALEIEQRLEQLDPDELDQFHMAALVGSCDYDMQGSWIPIRDADQLDARLPNAMALALLGRAVLECWVLPTLVDDYSDTTPVSPTRKTSGASGSSETDGTSPAPPAPLPAATRAPPLVQRHR